MTKDDRIIVMVAGGVVQDVQFPVGCQVPVAVHDYDVDGADDPGLEFDERGDPFVEAMWEPGEREMSTPSTPASSDAVEIVAHLSGVSDAEVRRILIEIYRWMYWDDERGCWLLDKEVGGADTVQLLCELLPGPPDVSEQEGSGPVRTP